MKKNLTRLLPLLLALLLLLASCAVGGQGSLPPEPEERRDVDGISLKRGVSSPLSDAGGRDAGFPER